MSQVYLYVFRQRGQEVDISSFNRQEEFERLEQELLGRDRRYRRERKGLSIPDPAAVRAELTDFMDHEDDFVPSYAAALDPLHYERKWIIRSVSGFYRDNLISDLTRLVKGGKEANVYCCLANPVTGVDLIAAKLYRPRMLRHLRNDALYKEGRLVLDKDGKELHGGREARAMIKKTRFGQDLGFSNWIMHEFGVQTELYEDGADVPKPIAHRGNAILMAYIGDEWGPAPTLSEISIRKEIAPVLFERAMENVRLMLAHHYVHGDLSAYNILFWEDQIRIIDFPQMVDARKNQNAFMLLQRDVQRVCDYFNQYGIGADPISIVTELWEEYINGRL